MVSNTTLKNKKMKYIIALLFALTFSKIDAQNVQFSQVLTFSMSSSDTYVVPNGKVWKIEYAALSPVNSVSKLQVNGLDILLSMNTSNTNSFPIWLKSNDVISMTASSGVPACFISIIEFSIVP
jgi:hypothetical protein